MFDNRLPGKRHADQHVLSLVRLYIRMELQTSHESTHDALLPSTQGFQLLYHCTLTGFGVCTSRLQMSYLDITDHDPFLQSSAVTFL